MTVSAFRPFLALLLLGGGLLVLRPIAAAEGLPAIPLWPALPPGETSPLPAAEADLTKPTDGLVADRRLIRLGNVSSPTLTVYRPAPDKDTGAAVLVCPGGGYHILALDLEGAEVCEWLNSVGVSGVLLKYRVPKREGREKHAPALQDAQRALGLMRSRAGEWGWRTNRLGVLGFSAGGHLAAALSTTPVRTYPAVDAADQVSCRPDFAVLVYPAYLTVAAEGDKVSPELSMTNGVPPTFLTITQDDPVRVEGALFYYAALQRAKVPSELHVFPTGGHGYGLRRTANPATAWTDRAADWMRHQGWLAR